MIFVPLPLSRACQCSFLLVSSSILLPAAAPMPHQPLPSQPVPGFQSASNGKGDTFSRSFSLCFTHVCPSIQQSAHCHLPCPRSSLPPALPQFGSLPGHQIVPSLTTNPHPPPTHPSPGTGSMLVLEFSSFPSCNPPSMSSRCRVSWGNSGTS